MPVDPADDKPTRVKIKDGRRTDVKTRVAQERRRDPGGSGKMAKKSRKTEKAAKSKAAAGRSSRRQRAKSRPPRKRKLIRATYRTSSPALTKQFSYKNPMQVPRLQKITVNMGLGAAVGNPKIIDSAVDELRAITGQKPVVTRAKKSIATFKLREGVPIGVMVTLRRERMWEFLDRLVVDRAPPRARLQGREPAAASTGRATTRSV